MVYVNDLRIVNDRDIEDILIVDNSILSFGFQLENGVPICSFMTSNKERDQELIYLLTYLEEVFHQKDMQLANSKMFKLRDLMAKVIT
jgi:CTD small phosphatase-like protein 2